MAQLVLTNLPPAVVAKLEERARDTNTTVGDLAGRLLARVVEEESYWITDTDGWPRHVGPTEGVDLDHRTVREERMEALSKGALEGSR